MQQIPSKGIAILELVVGLAIISIALSSLLSTYKAHLRAALLNTDTVKASYLAEETLEVVRYLRDSSWTRYIAALAEGMTYYLYWNGSSWSATTSASYVDGIARSFTLSPVYRDASDDIVASGGTVDSNTKKVEATVAWASASGTTTKTVATYLTNLFAN